MDFLEFKSKIEYEFKEKIGIDLSEVQCKSFFDYMNCLIEKNKVMNLTAITEPSEVILRHFVDSSILLKFDILDGSLGQSIKNKFKDCKLIDVGTGAGFPGLPLAILCPDAKFVLSDTLGKRINFLQEVIDLLNLKNIELVKARAEDLAHDKKYRESYDFVLSRGVAKVSVLSEYSLPFVKIGGSMLAWKMSDIDLELSEGKKAIEILGGMFHEKHNYDLLDNEPERCIIDVVKIKTSPKNYPRKAGIPSKLPIA